ncbi:MAG: class I SAM-dependent methyltransferase, partial [Hyphomicrobiales bacterium]
MRNLSNQLRPAASALHHFNAARGGYLRRVVATLATVALLGAAPALAQAPAAQPTPAAPDYVPSSGQAGKDVVWVPTPQALVDTMLDMAKLTPNDFHMDLGSGDGRTVITAAKRGSKSLGIEYEPEMVALAKSNAAREGVTDKASFEKADLFETDFSKAQVLTLFLLPSINEKLRPKILDMKPGTRVVSNTFRMGDWEPDQTSAAISGCQSWCSALLWIVPAKVEGSWKVDGKDLKLTQKYQVLTGTLGTDTISDAKMNGNEITFKANGATYTG